MSHEVCAETVSPGNHLQQLLQPVADEAKIEGWDVAVCLRKLFNYKNLLMLTVVF